MNEPTFALSVRQPWAWCILNGKPVENRTWPTKFRGPLWLHAGKGMTREEYQACVIFVASFCSLRLPLFAELRRGGIVGKAILADCVATHPSEWFTGPFGFVLDKAEAVPFRPCNGALGFFKPDFKSPTPDQQCPTLL